MSTEVKPAIQLEIAHVLFIDVVGYSKLLMDDQRELQDQLNLIVRSTKQFRTAEAESKLVRLPTGDGMALVFFTSPEAPVQCALDISKAVLSYPRLQLRMGINTGPISVTSDVNDRSNIAGAGINMAKRVMDCGDAGHILISKRLADDLAQYRQWRPHLHELGECVTKHGERISLFNLSTGEFGNPDVPEKFKFKSDRVASGFSKKWQGAALLTGLVLIAAFTAFFLLRPSVQKLEKSLAVLPFENLSDDKENGYFAGGIQDDVLTNLAKIGDLKVISRTSVRQYTSNVSNVRDIAKALGVAAVLEGTVRRVGNRVRVNVQLINASTDQHIWAEEYDRDLTDVFAIQSELALQIASALQTRLSPAEKARLERRPTKNGEAYLFYLQGQDLLARIQSGANLEKAASLYEKAIQLDPTFALALARLSDVECTLYQGNGDPSSLAKAQAAANEAIRLQPGLPEAHLALAHIHYRGERDYDKALRELAIARSGLPNDPDVFLLTGSIERRQGRWSQSTADLEKAVSVNPKDGFIWANVATSYQALRNYTAAAKAFDRGIAADPKFFMNQYLRAQLDIDWKADLVSMEQLLARTPEGQDPDGRVTLARFHLKLFQRKFDEALQVLHASPLDNFLGWRAGVPFPKPFLFAQIYRLMNDKTKARPFFEQAQRIIESAVRENPLDASRHALLGQIHAGLGRKEDAIWEGRRAIELLPESKDALDGPAIALRLAEIYTMVGDLDSAIPLIEHSLATPGGTTVLLLKLDPIWDPLRRDQRFQRMMASVNLKGPEL